jgi:uncharacterized protein YbjT (DUF2867 family)
VIAVVGATGAQGGGLVRAILADKRGGFAARAITRDVHSDKAKPLAASGAEVVAADVNDEASLQRAFEGAYGAFCVTFFWAHVSVEREQAEAAAYPCTPRIPEPPERHGRSGRCFSSAPDWLVPRVETRHDLRALVS